MFEDLSQARMIAIDIETRDLSITAGLGAGELRPGCFIAGVSLATDDGHAEYYPIAHETGENLSREKVFNYLNEQLGGDQPKIGHVIRYDLSYLHEAGVTVCGKFYDTQIAEGLLDENLGTGGYSLDALAHKYVGVGKDSDMLYEYCASKFGGKANRKQQAKNIWRAPGHIVRDYAISDVILPLQIYKKQHALLQDENLLELYELECSLIPMLLAMRKRGIRVDSIRVEALKIELAQSIATTQKELYAIFGREFNLSSPKQLGEMFVEMGLETQKTATGKVSTSKKVLAMMQHPAAIKLLDMRASSTLLNTFLNGYCTKHLLNGRLHCQLHSMKSDAGGTVTGRFSCSEPNLQNIPKKHDSLIRTLFLPEDGEIWKSDDYSQIEYRLLVHYARGDSAEIARQAYIENPDTDYHAYVKNIIFERTGKDIPRTHVKSINFGLMYTMGKKSLAANLQLELSDAEELFKTYHGAVPYVQETQRRFALRAAQRGYVHTLLGRRRRFNLWEPADFKDRRKPLPHAEALTEYEWIKRAKTKDALNAGLQGGCADILKFAMQKIWQAGICDVLGAPLITVHDELNWSVPNTKEGLAAHAEAIHIMQTCIQLKVPLLVSSKQGYNWGELE